MGIPSNVPALVEWIHHADQPRLEQTAYLAQVLPGYAVLCFEPGDRGEYTDVGYLDYVHEEILSRQPLPVQRFLLQTAVLRRMNAGLCIALTQDTTSQTLLEWLERHNLFAARLFSMTEPEDNIRAYLEAGEPVR